MHLVAIFTVPYETQRFNTVCSRNPTTGFCHKQFNTVGRAVAQAVSRWLPTAATRQRVGFVVDKAALGQVFSEYFGFPCQSSFHQFLHHHNHPGLAQ
jgi:hypothetical protein